MRLFIGWSGPMSFAVAGVLRDKLPGIFPAIDPFVSTYDITKGNPWSKDLEEELRTAGFGIVCVTHSNVNSPWLNFEAGALSKGFHVAPFLFHMDPKSLQGGPLGQFQTTAYEKHDILKLMKDINETLDPENKVSPDQLAATFEPWWIELNTALQGIASTDETETPYEWLYTVEDLRRAVTDPTSKCIMVVSTEPNNDFNLFFVQNMIRPNLERGVSYAVLIAKSTPDRKVIEDVFSSHPGQLCLTPIPDHTFETSAVTHCCLLNYECNASLKVFLELPVKEQVEQTYWIKVNQLAALRFAQRFRELRDKHRHAPCFEKSTSEQPPQPLHDGQDAVMM